MTTDFEGKVQLHGAFVAHAQDVDKRISRLMVASGGRIVKNEAKRIAMSKLKAKTGALFKNIAIKREKTPDGITQYNLGVRHGRELGRKAQSELAVGKNGRVLRRYVNNPYYWFLHEFGLGHNPKRDFIGPALESKREEAVAAMEKRLQDEINKRNSE
jgi:HK97 gp10 family phage protein